MGEIKGIVYDSWLRDSGTRGGYIRREQGNPPRDILLSPRLIRYEPGNGTSYALLLVPIWGPGVCKDLSLDESEQWWLVSWVNNDRCRPTMIVASRSYVHPSYAAEKMGVTHVDARPISDLINTILGEDE